MQFSFVILYHTFDRKSSIFPWFGCRDVNVLPGRMGFLMPQLSIRKLFPEGRFHSIGRFLFPGDIGNLDFQDLRSPPSFCSNSLAVPPSHCPGSHSVHPDPERPHNQGRYGTMAFTGADGSALGRSSP